MFIFNRRFLAKQGHAGALGAALASLGPSTANLSGLTWSVSAAVGTGSVGSFGVVAVLPDLAAFESGVAKLNADSAWLAEGQKMLLEHVATAEDLMVEVIGGSIRPEGAGPVQQTIVGIAAPGKLSEASAGTIDSAALWIKHGALSTVAMLGITGPLGQLGLGASYDQWSTIKPFAPRSEATPSSARSSLATPRRSPLGASHSACGA